MTAVASISRKQIKKAVKRNAPGSGPLEVAALTAGAERLSTTRPGPPASESSDLPDYQLEHC